MKAKIKESIIFISIIFIICNLLVTLPYITLYKYFENKNIKLSAEQINLWKESFTQILTNSSVDNKTKVDLANSLTNINQLQNSKTKVVIYMVLSYHVLICLFVISIGVFLLVKKQSFKYISISIISSGILSILLTILILLSSIKYFIF